MGNRPPPGHLVVEARPGGLLPTTGDGIRDLVRRAEAGDASTLPAIRELLAQPGAVAGLGGDLARRAQESLITAYAGDNLLAREAIATRLEELRTELAGPSPTPVERLLAERAAVCWLHVYQLEVLSAGKLRQGMGAGLAEHFQKTLDRAHKRYLSALKALADVRRLAGPAVQVNIARKQVNVAGSPSN